MKRLFNSRVLLCTILLAGFSYSAFAQIVIDETRLSRLLDTSERIVSISTDAPAELTPIIAATGPDQTWDFTATTYTDTTSGILTYSRLPADVLGSSLPVFANAQFAISTTGMDEEGNEATFVFYQGLSGDSLLGYGGIATGVLEGVRDTSVLISSPPELDLLLPLTYETSWRDSTTTIIDGESFPAYEITEVRVDGWGTLITPAGTAPALRLHYDVKNYLDGSPVPFFEESFLDFQTNGDLEAYLLIGTGDFSTSKSSSMVAVEASYSVREPVTSTSISEEVGLPEGFTLSQNFPNPFNPTTTINYEIEANTHVRLRVVSLTGEEIRTLVDGTQTAGTYQVRFDASGLASGLYLYQLETNRGRQSRLMTVVK